MDSHKADVCKELIGWLFLFLMLGTVAGCEILGNKFKNDTIQEAMKNGYVQQIVKTQSGEEKIWTKEKVNER